MNRILPLLILLFGFQSLCIAEQENADRPKVGLVLGGGGALGIAHIGVLRVLEEQRIPIDYIGGTSMGAIIAGLYASGMSPDEIEAFLSGLDWNEVMSDRTPRRQLSFRRKFEDQRYLLELGVGRDGLKLGTGLAAGQKFNNLLEYQVQRASGITNFNNLSIPYRAVGTDLYTGKAHVMDHGHLARSMRASMAVPGVFTPVAIDDVLMIDGGIVNNLPVDVVKEMGADIIIAVDVGAASDVVDKEKLNSLGGILGRTYAIAQRPGQLESLKEADVGMQPDLADFTASQFDRVLELIPKGEEVARSKIPEFQKLDLSVNEEEFDAYIAGHRRPNPSSVILDSVGVSGQERVSEKAILGRIESEPGAEFDVNTIQLDLMRIYGIGEFEQVLYRLEQDTDGTGSLNYAVTEKSTGPLYMNVGLNLRTDFQDDTEWSILVNLTRRSLNDLGGEWRNDIVLGSVQSVLSEFYQPLDPSGYFFIAPTVDFRSEIQDVYDNKSHIAEYEVQTTEVKLDLGMQLNRYAELRVGPAWGHVKADVETGFAGLPDFDEIYVGPQASLIVDRQDRTYFPREGYYFSVRGLFPQDDFGGDDSFDKVEADLSVSQSIEDHTLEVGLQYGTGLGDELPEFTKFTLGGPNNFSGLAENQFRGSTLGIIRTSYRYRIKEIPSQLGKGIYVSTSYDVGNVWDKNGIDTDDLRHGLAAGIGIDTSFGPVYFAYGIADGGYRRFYFTLGADF